MFSRSNLLICFLLGIAGPLVMAVPAVALPMLLPENRAAIYTAALVAIVAVVILAPFTRIAIGFTVFLLKANLLKRPDAATEYGITPPLCRACGYDLRASPDVCPECGQRVDSMDAVLIRYLMSLRRRDEIEHRPIEQAGNGILRLKRSRGRG